MPAMTNATQPEILTRLAAIEDAVTGITAAYPDYVDNAILTANLPAFTNMVGRVVSNRRDTLGGSFIVVQEYTSLLHVSEIPPGNPTRYSTDARDGVYAYFLPVTAVFDAKRKLELGTGTGIVFHADMTADGVARRLARAQKSYWGLVWRWRITTYHTA